MIEDCFLGKIRKLACTQVQNLHWKIVQNAYSYKLSLKVICLLVLSLTKIGAAFLITNQVNVYYKLGQNIYKSGQLLQIGTINTNRGTSQSCLKLESEALPGSPQTSIKESFATMVNGS